MFKIHTILPSVDLRQPINKLRLFGPQPGLYNYNAFK